MQSLRSEKRGLKKARCEMVKDFALNSGRKINSLKLRKVKFGSSLNMLL